MARAIARLRATVWGELLIVGTAFLLMFVLALTDERNQPPKANLAPLLIGLAVAAIGMSFGANAGYAFNPARDFGPRFFAWLAGWGQVAFPGAHGYFWVPIVGPFVGGVLGAIVYDLFVGDVLRARGSRRPRTSRGSARQWRSGRPRPTGRSTSRAAPSGNAERRDYLVSRPVCRDGA